INGPHRKTSSDVTAVRKQSENSVLCGGKVTKQKKRAGPNDDSGVQAPSPMGLKTDNAGIYTI
ncbi:hypothetical protein ACQP3C_27610, partial [Escherichia coli]